MKIVHAVIVLLLSALFLGIVAGVATANVPGVAINAPNVPAQEGQGLVTVVVTHRDVSIPSTYYVDPTAYKASMGPAKPSVTVTPTKVRMSNKVTGELRMKPSPTAKYVQLLGRKPSPVPTVKATASPVPTKRNASPTMTPAQSYGIYGLGGDTPYFNKTTPSPLAPRTSTAGTGGMVPLSSPSRNAGRGPGFEGSSAVQATGTPTKGTVTPVSKISINPTASPTPVPGGYTPRFPGEPGYKGSPTPTGKATVTAKPSVTKTPVARR